MVTKRARVIAEEAGTPAGLDAPQVAVLERDVDLVGLPTGDVARALGGVGRGHVGRPGAQLDVEHDGLVGLEAMVGHGSPGCVQPGAGGCRSRAVGWIRCEGVRPSRSAGPTVRVLRLSPAGAGFLLDPGLDRLGDPDQGPRCVQPGGVDQGSDQFGTAEDVDEDLAVGVSLLDVADRVGGVVDRITPVDHRSKDAGLHHVNQRLEVLCR